MAQAAATNRVFLGTTAPSAGVLLTITASLLWGTTFVATGIGLHYTNPYNLVFLRFSAASAAIVVLAVLFNGRLNVRMELGRGATWVLGAIYALGYLFQYVGQDFANTSDATLLSNLAPILVPLAAFAVLKENVSGAQMGAMGFGFLGLALVASPKLRMGSGHLVGDLMLFASSICYAFFIVLSKRLNADSVASAFAIVVSITAFLAPVAFLLGGLNPLELSIGAAGWASIVYLGLPCSVLALSLYLKGLNSITASQSANLLLIEILIGLVLASLVLGETLSFFAATGAASISVAIFLSSKRRN